MEKSRVTRQTEKQRQRDRETDIQTDRQTDILLSRLLMQYSRFKIKRQINPSIFHSAVCVIKPNTQNRGFHALTTWKFNHHPYLFNFIWYFLCYILYKT